MLKLSPHQQAMLHEMGVILPLPNAAQPTPRSETTTAQAPSEKTVFIKAPDTLKAAAHKPSTKPQAIEPIPSTDVQPPSTSPSPTLSERSQTISQMPWEDLQQASKSCQACALCASRRNVVFGVGNHDAKWMIVGEAPGEQEDRQGEPFVGQAGKLLDKMLTQLNISRYPKKDEHSIYIANVLKCRPPHNRNPEAQEIAQCEPYLKRQIELIQPKVILAMGRFAVQSLLQKNEAIGRLRGRAHVYQGIPVVVTYHPAYLLRNPVDKRKSWEDLCLAADLFDKD